MSDKKLEILRTLEVSKDILEREGITNRGMLLLVYFLRDQGRALGDLLEVWHEEYKRNTKETNND